MSSTISTTPTQQNDLPKPMSETELRQALKQKVSALCNQIFNGCHRSCCYNVYCSKNKTSLQSKCNITIRINNVFPRCCRLQRQTETENRS